MPSLVDSSGTFTNPDDTYQDAVKAPTTGTDTNTDTDTDSGVEDAYVTDLERSVRPARIGALAIGGGVFTLAPILIFWIAGVSSALQFLIPLGIAVIIGASLGYVGVLSTPSEDTETYPAD